MVGREISFVHVLVWLVALWLLMLVSWFVMKREVVLSIAVHLSIFLTGGALSSQAIDRLVLLSSDEPRCYEAVISSPPVRHGKVLMCDMTLVNGDTPMLLKASIWNDTLSQRLRVGNGIRFWSRCEMPNREPGSSFDYGAYLRNNGYAGTVFVGAGWWENAEVDLSILSLFQRTRLRLAVVRDRLVKQMASSGINDNALALVSALTLGDRSRLTKETKEMFATTGVSHMLALSGLHLGLIYGFLVMLVFRRRTSPWATIALICIIAGYAMLVGMSASIVRAALMLGIYTLMTSVRHDHASLNVLAFAAFVLLVVNPLTLYDVGFQLSFISVASIMLFQQPLCELLSARKWYCRMKEHWWGRALDKVWGLVCVSLAAQIGVSPLLVYYFHGLSTCFVVANLVVLPLVVVMIMTGFALLVFSQCAWLSTLCVRIIDGCTSILESSMQNIASWPNASIDNLHISGIQVALLYLTLLATFTFYMRFIRGNRKIDHL
ncbi:MAG: ComEC/Rec2 family competence protein [Prevotella sp.]|nr:ComEC/Rec2 family competence protein [Prevotella sp.]